MPPAARPQRRGARRPALPRYVTSAGGCGRGGSGRRSGAFLRRINPSLSPLPLLRPSRQSQGRGSGAGCSAALLRQPVGMGSGSRISHRHRGRAGAGGAVCRRHWVGDAGGWQARLCLRASPGGAGGKIHLAHASNAALLAIIWSRRRSLSCCVVLLRRASGPPFKGGRWVKPICLFFV